MKYRSNTVTQLLALIVFAIAAESSFLLLLEDIVYFKASISFLGAYKIVWGIITDIQVTNQWLLPISFWVFFFLLIWMIGNRAYQKYPDSPVMLFLLNIVFFTFVLSSGSRIINNHITFFKKLFGDMGQSLPGMTAFISDNFGFLWEKRLSPLPLSLLFSIGLFIQISEKSTLNSKIIFQLFVFLLQLILFTIFGFALYYFPLLTIVE